MGERERKREREGKGRGKVNRGVERGFYAPVRS